MDEANVQLEAAIPAMEAAEGAVDCLSAKAIVEFKSFAQPPPGTELVTRCVQILKGETNKKKLQDWGAQAKMMNPPQAFLDSLKAFDKDAITQKQKDDLKTSELLGNPIFTFEIMQKKSSAAANLANWVINVVRYNDIYVVVEPLKKEAEESKAQADQKAEELKVVQDRVAAIIEKVNGLKADLAAAEAKKEAVVAQATALQQSLDLANRLVNGLADENVRWQQNVVTYQHEKLTMIGNTLVSAAFVSYIGPFSSTFRNNLWRDQWIPDIVTAKIPFTEGVDPLDILSTPSQQALWASEGLPADRVSTENAAVVVSCSRYPLLIDPQLQGIKWIRGKEGADLQSIQLTAAKWQKKVELAVSSGQVLMIDSIGQDIDAMLDPLLSRQFIKRGKALFVKLGAEEVEVANTFKLYLQTKLINPHYKPETAAQCTIVNFIVTESGLEDQLLAMVVRVEKPELEATKEALTKEQQDFIITLAKLEADLLHKLVSADSETILENVDLIESLEKTKETSTTIKEKQELAKLTEKEINDSREAYRPVAAEGAMLYFLLIQLWIIDHMYQYSLESFTSFFFKAIEKTADSEDLAIRVPDLILMIRITIYQWVSRGLFERHKQILMTMLTFRLMQKNNVQVQYTT
jgi:dynein heavy chain